MSADNELHGTLLGFLTGELARKEGRQCVSVDLLYAPGNGFRDEEIRDTMIRTWTREDEPDLFDKFVGTEQLVSSIIEVAESEADCMHRGSHRFIVRTRQLLGTRASRSFVLSPTHKESAIMKCLSCQKPMNARVGDFDYSRLAGLRGVIVTLRDVKLYQCESCGPTSAFVEICRIAVLTRDLEAARTIHVKQLWCSFRDNEWVIAFTPAKMSKGRRGRRSS